MLSYASDGGGVGPHLDSYDVFLIQVHGRRRWRIGRARDRSFVEGLPLKILRHFEPEHDWVLEPGDMLYLPPQWAHDGVAVGECMTASVGFRAPGPAEVARELLSRLAEDIEPATRERLYGDAGQPATATPGAVPPALQAFAADALQQALRDPQALARALGEWLTEPKPRVWFDAPTRRVALAGGCGAGPAHTHDVRRPPCVHQRRVLPCRRARRTAAAPTGRPAVPGGGRGGAAQRRGARHAATTGRGPAGCRRSAT